MNLNTLAHEQAMRLQAAELDRTLATLHSLEPNDWSAQTDCPEWDVKRMYLHVVGACEGGASVRENVRQLVAARRHQGKHHGALEASLSAIQIQSRIGLTSQQIVDRLTAIAGPMVRARTKVPGLMRRAKISVDGPIAERWSLGYLIDTIYLRDLWMHRIDMCRATGRTMVLTPEHDGVIVADIVAEWAHRHGEPYHLTLGGPAGGQFMSDGTTATDDAARLELDAVEFCRTLSGRTPGVGLLATIVPF